MFVCILDNKVYLIPYPKYRRKVSTLSAYEYAPFEMLASSTSAGICIVNNSIFESLGISAEAMLLKIFKDSNLSEQSKNDIMLDYNSETLLRLVNDDALTDQCFGVIINEEFHHVIHLSKFPDGKYDWRLSSMTNFNDRIIANDIPLSDYLNVCFQFLKIGYKGIDLVGRLLSYYNERSVIDAEYAVEIPIEYFKKENASTIYKLLGGLNRLPDDATSIDGIPYRRFKPIPVKSYQEVREKYWESEAGSQELLREIEESAKKTKRTRKTPKAKNTPK